MITFWAKSQIFTIPRVKECAIRIPCLWVSFLSFGRVGVISSAIIKFENDKSDYVMGNFSITDLSVDLITQLKSTLLLHI